MFRLCCRKARRIAEQDLRRSTHRLGGMDHAFMGCARLSLCGHLPTVQRRADGSRCNQDLGCWNFPRDIAHIGGSDQDLATGTQIYEYLENELQNPLNSKKAGSIASSYA